MSFITVYEYEDSDPVEIPLEEDETILFTTLSGQFPKVSGLKYRYSGSTNFRAIKLYEGKLYKPIEGWDNLKLICVFPKEIDNKRKCKEEYEISTPKTKRLETRKCTDLIVLNLGWKVDEEMLRNYFSKFGELVLVQVKKDRETNHSKGYAFVRFADYDEQVLCLAEKHLIDGRWCAVKVPFSKSEADKQEISKKIHVSYNSEEIEMEDLKKSFEEYGYVTDIFIPKPFRNFAFVTFDASDVAQRLIGRTITVKGHALTIGSAVPKIVGNKKGTAGVQFAACPYNEQIAFPNNRFNWGGAYDRAAVKISPYKSRQFRNNNNKNNSAFGSYGGALMTTAASNQSFVPAVVNGHTHSNLISIEYAHQSPSDIGQNTAAMAALNILNNPDVVAAIVAAASKSGLPQQQQHNLYSHQQ